MFVNDACEGIRRLAEVGEIGEIYNLGTRFEHSILDLATNIHQIIAELRGTEPGKLTLTPIPDRPYNDQRYLIDSTKVWVRYKPIFRNC